ncbi:equilibrative nucleotide transporter 3-like isoform X2 [Nicotiana tomentosiformis]|uniref:equilibrative nucleotide transporter 3-like isoform X2 n=1 Tax=Nicotiana tomentosiformis TaxID=4098 RepID=UPI00388C8841
MTIADSSRISSPTRLEGKYSGMVKYHPSRVLTLVYQPFALATMAILAYNEARIDTRKRNLAGFTLFFLTTFALLVLDLATSGKGGLGNYIGICAIIAAFGVADAFVEGGMVGDLSFMCPEFIQSYLAGLVASGALTSALRLVTKAAFEKSSNGLHKGVMLFLAISTFFEFLCILLYAFIFPKLPIVKYYRTKAAAEGSKTVAADLAAAGIQTEATKRAVNSAIQLERLSNKQLFFQNIDYLLDLFLIYVLTLSIFPGFVLDLCPDFVNLPWILVREYWYPQIRLMVCFSPNSSLQHVRSDSKIHSTDRENQAKITKGPNDRNTISFLVHSLFLLHC